MILLLWIPIMAMLVWGFWRIIWRDSIGDGEAVAIALGIIIGIVFLFPCILIPINNGMDLAQWEAFYDTNVANYTITVDKTASYLSVEKFESQLIGGSVEKWQQAGYVSERLREWRDAVNEYNLTMASMRWVDRNIWIGVFMPPIPERLVPLVIR